MARSLEELPRSLTGIRLGWSAIALLLSFVVALSISSKKFHLRLTASFLIQSIIIHIHASGFRFALESAVSASYGTLLATLCTFKICGDLGSVGSSMQIQYVFQLNNFLRLFVGVGYLLLLGSIGCLIAFVVMAHLEGVSDWHFCSWNAAALGTIWVCT